MLDVLQRLELSIMDVIWRIDVATLQFVQDYVRRDWLTPVMKTASFLGDVGLMWIVLGLILVVFKKTRRGGAYMLSGLACEYVVNDLIIKNIFMRIRPYDAGIGIVNLVPALTSSSFPSGHTASSFVCAYMLTKVFGGKGALSYIPAVLIALSRLYVGVHYLSDVFCGAVIGTAVGAFVYCMLRKIVQKRGEKTV